MKLQQDILFADRYRLIKRIGQGGFAEVWLADDTLTDIQVAVKIYGGMDDEGLKIFVKEINKVYHLNHTNLLKPQHVAAWQGMPYLVMTYCAAGSLEKKIGQITEQEIWKIIHDVASGLDYLHSNNIIHQDIKPANILQDDMGNYVIIDFGISTLARDTLRKSTLMGNTSAGTLAYMGPERFMKDSAPIFASDIWSLGAMLYELLESKTPFPADFGGGMQKAGAEVPDITADVSKELKLLISKMLSLNTWERPTAKTLVQWASNPSAIVVDTTPNSQSTVKKNLPKASQPSKPESKRWIWIVLALLILAGLSILGIREVQRHQIAIAEQEQRYQDSIRQIQIQDSLREVRRQDSIRVERRRDSIAASQRAEKERQERLRREAEEADRRRIENEKKRIEEERRRAGLGSHNGHDYVDLGLSVKWATCNIGAYSPNGYGSYFAWGETASKSSYTWDNYKWYAGKYEHKAQYVGDYDWTYYKQKKYVTDSRYGSVDNKQRLDLFDDAANANWGGRWRMPTLTEVNELSTNCTWEWIYQGGVAGFRGTSKINGKTIFLPAAGACFCEMIPGGGHMPCYLHGKGESIAYWTSSLAGSFNADAIRRSTKINHPFTLAMTREAGLSVRAVCP